jgi:ABC-type glycerol-3-phosphate transport system substrate-binding protein
MPFVITAALVSFAAGACGAPTPSSADPYLGNLAGRTVEVVATWSGAEQENFRAVLDEFSRRTHATVKYTSGGTDLAVLINSRLAGGRPPDIAFIPQPGVVAQLARRGVLAPISGTAEQAVRANYDEIWQQLGTVDGQLYGLYFKVANKSVIWYRADAFDEAGVSPPSTWDELREVSTTLNEAGITPMATAGADGWVLTDWFENTYLRHAGPQRYDDLARRALPWTDASVVQTLELLADYWHTPRFVHGGLSGATQVTFSQAVAEVFGARPSTAMVAEGDFVASEIRKLGQVEVGEGAQFFAWPTVAGSPPAVVAAGDQAVAFRESPETNALLTFLASPEAAHIMASQGGFLSANRNLDQTSYVDDTTRALAAAVADAQVLRFDLSDLAPQSFGGGSSAHMWVLLQDFLEGEADAVETARRLEEAAVQDFGELASRTALYGGERASRTALHSGDVDGGRS